MAGNTFSVKATFDGSELVNGFKDVKNEINGLSTAGQTAEKSLSSMLQQKNSTSNYARQLSQIKQQLTDLAVNYSKLSDAEKNSDFGVAMSARIDELTAKAQQLKGVMDDVNSSLAGGTSGPKDFGEHWSNIQRSTEQTRAKFEGIQKVSAGVASGFAAIQGAAALLGAENEDLQKALLKVQSAMAIAQGIGGLKDFFEGLTQLKAAFTFTTAATVANAAATASDTASKGANTVATNINTAAIEANNAARRNGVAANAAYATSLKTTTAASGKSSAASGVFGTILTGLGKKIKSLFAPIGRLLKSFTSFKNLAKAIKGPWTAIIALIASLGVLLYKGKKQTDEIKKAQEEYNKKIQKQNELELERERVVSSSVGDVLSKYKLLQIGWSNLQSDYERTEWIENNANAFSDLGLAITDIASAQKMLVSNAPKVVEALRLQAQAAALSDLYKENYKKAYTLDVEIKKQTEQLGRKYKEGYIPTDDEIEAANLNDNDYMAVWSPNSLWDQWWNNKPRGEMKPTAAIDNSGADKLIGLTVGPMQQELKVLKDQQKQLEEDLKEANKLAKEAADAAGINVPARKTTRTGGTGGGTKPKPVTLGDLQKTYEAETKELDDAYNKGITPYLKYLEAKKQATDKYIKSIVDLEGDLTESQLAVINPMQQASDKLQELIDKEEERIDLENQVKAFEKEKLKAEIEFANATTRISQLEKDGIISATESRENQIDAAKEYYNFLIANWGKLSENEKNNAKAIKSTIEAYEKLNNTPDRGKSVEWRDYQSQQANKVAVEYEAGIITFGAAKKAIDEINADLEKLGLKPLELKIDDGSLAAFEERYASTMNVMDSSASIISSVGYAFGAVVSAINDENTALGAVVGTLDQGAKSWLDWGVNSVNTIAQVLPQIAQVILAQQAQALAGGIASGASLPFPANMAVIASVVATLLALFASLPKFATGGIVNGSGIGDMNLARVNGGEMILNGRQQSNLFRMLDQNRIARPFDALGDVNFRIQGSTLVGVIDNYNKKRSRG